MPSRRIASARSGGSSASVATCSASRQHRRRLRVLAERTVGPTGEQQGAGAGAASSPALARDLLGVRERVGRPPESAAARGRARAGRRPAACRRPARPPARRTRRPCAGSPVAEGPPGGRPSAATPERRDGAGRRVRAQADRSASATARSACSATNTSRIARRPGAGSRRAPGRSRRRRRARPTGRGRRAARRGRPCRCRRTPPRACSGVANAYPSAGAAQHAPLRAAPRWRAPARRRPPRPGGRRDRRAARAAPPARRRGTVSPTTAASRSTARASAGQRVDAGGEHGGEVAGEQPAAQRPGRQPPAPRAVAADAALGQRAALHEQGDQLGEVERVALRGREQPVGRRPRQPAAAEVRGEQPGRVGAAQRRQRVHLGVGERVSTPAVRTSSGRPSSSTSTGPVSRDSVAPSASTVSAVASCRSSTMTTQRRLGGQRAAAGRRPRSARPSLSGGRTVAGPLAPGRTTPRSRAARRSRAALSSRSAGDRRAAAAPGGAGQALGRAGAAAPRPTGAGDPGRCRRGGRPIAARTRSASGREPAPLAERGTAHRQHPRAGARGVPAGADVVAGGEAARPRRRTGSCRCPASAVKTSIRGSPRSIDLGEPAGDPAQLGLAADERRLVAEAGAGARGVVQARAARTPRPARRLPLSRSGRSCRQDGHPPGGGGGGRRRRRPRRSAAASASRAAVLTVSPMTVYSIAGLHPGDDRAGVEPDPQARAGRRRRARRRAPGAPPAASTARPARPARRRPRAPPGAPKTAMMPSPVSLST